MESSKFKLNKKKFIQISLLLLAFLLIFFTYFLNLKKKQPSTNLDQIKIVKPDKEKGKVVNTFVDVQYSGLDKNGNRFVIDSKYAHFEINQPNIIKMEEVLCIFYFKDQTSMTVRSSHGIYNNVTDDMEFKDQVKMTYFESVLFADKASFMNMKNVLLVEGNVKTSSPEGKLQADRLDFDLNSKQLKISMDSNEKVNIKVNY